MKRIENDRMILEVTEKAGEMTSLFDKQKNREILYQGNQGWSGRNPSLFPMIGKTWNDGKYTWKNQEYQMKNHGLIRYASLDLTEKGNQIICHLSSNEETRKQYPFDFDFTLTYTLLEDGVQVDYTIENTGNEDMPFSFGLHPAFITSQNPEEKFEDFSIEFFPKGKAEQIVFHSDLSPVERKEVQLDKWQLSREDLKEYATLVYDQNPVQEAILSWKDEPRMKMTFPDYPQLALWSIEQPSDYICIEPWHGHSDFEKVTVPFDQREGTMILKPQETFKASYTIEAL